MVGEEGSSPRPVVTVTQLGGKQKIAFRDPFRLAHRWS